MNTNTEQIDERLQQILDTGMIPPLELNTEWEKCLTGELMMLDRLDLLHTMVARQLTTIETGYVRVTCSKELLWR